MDDAQRLDALLVRTGALPPEQAAPQVRAFFDGLGPAAATRLADQRPDQVGELNGVPARLRFRVNLQRITRDRDALQVVVDAGGASKQDRRRLETLNELLIPVRMLTTGPDGRPLRSHRHRQFLSVRTEGRGRAVEVHGELSNARQVAVLVPGMGNSLDSMRDLVARSKEVQDESGPGTVAVTWLGYDSPAGVLGAVGKERTYDAAPGLRGDLVGLRQETPPGTELTGIGHSLGSVMIGQASLYGARFDRIVFTGSPGVDPDVRRAADLGRAMLFVERAPGDVVSYTQWHGPDPADFPDAIRLATAGGEPVRWHQQYYRPNTESLRNIGRVVRGDLSAVTTTDTSSGRETQLVPGIGWAGALRGAVVPVSVVYEGLAELRGVSPPPRLEVASRHTVPDQTQRERPDR